MPKRIKKEPKPYVPSSAGIVAKAYKNVTEYNVKWGVEGHCRISQEKFDSLGSKGPYVFLLALDESKVAFSLECDPFDRRPEYSLKEVGTHLVTPKKLKSGTSNQYMTNFKAGGTGVQLKHIVYRIFGNETLLLEHLRAGREVHHRCGVGR